MAGPLVEGPVRRVKGLARELRRDATLAAVAATEPTASRNRWVHHRPGLAMMVRSGLCLLVLLPLSAPGQECPNVDPASGYPVSASSEMTADSAWLSGVARAAAYRWQVPSRRRNAY